MSLEHGTEIDVIIGDKTYLPVIDENGTQRFPEVEGLRDLMWTETRGQKPPPKPVPPEVAELAKTNTAVAWLVANNPSNLNEMAYAFFDSKFNRLDYAEFNMHIGYSVSGWCELSSFEDMPVDNPLWESDLETLADAFNNPAIRPPGRRA
jgi:hypothetical protein